MANRNIKQIRAAVEANCGGFAGAADRHIIQKWNSLDSGTQAKYMEKVSGKNQKGTDNVSD